MKTKTNKWILLGALAGALAFGGVASAHPGGGGGHRGKGMGGGPAKKMLRLMSSLDLTEQQEVQLVRIKREMRKEMKDLRMATRADRKAAFEELSKDDPNAQRFHDMIDRHSKARVALMHKAIDRVMAFQRTLTPAQKQELQKKLAKIEKRWEKRRRMHEE